VVSGAGVIPQVRGDRSTVKGVTLAYGEAQDAEQLRENPGDDFLMERWADDPASEDCDQETGGEVSAVGVGGR